MEPDEHERRVRYSFPDGRETAQTYNLGAVAAETLDRACRRSQGLLRKSLVEMLGRHSETGELGAWEFDGGQSVWRLPSGRRPEGPCADLEACVERITTRTGMSPEVVGTALRVYAFQDRRT